MNNIAIIGAGRIGSAFAFRLAQADHAVTMIARGSRLADLERDGAVIDIAGKRSPVTVAGALDPATPFDAVLVTVLAHQLDAVLPALRASSAKQIVFLMNTFDPLDRLRDAVGADRCVFGFPVFIADFEGGKLRSFVDRPGQGVTIDDGRWAEVFRNAHISATVEDDMQSWLRAHVAAILPIMIGGRIVFARGGGLTWPEAARLATALDEGFAVVRALGHSVIPTAVAAVTLLPRAAKAGILWAMSRSSALGSLGDRGPEEPRALVDAVIAAAPTGASTDALRAIRP